MYLKAYYLIIQLKLVKYVILDCSIACPTHVDWNKPIYTL